MILKYALPNTIDDEIKLSNDERIYYAVPVDIDEKGKWTNDHFLVVTTKKIYVFGEEKKIFDIKDCDNAIAEPGVGGGILTVKHKCIE